MRSEPPPLLVACFDANVFVSALGFGGVPQRAVNRLLAGDFLHVTGPNILTETRRNAVGKLRLPATEVDTFLDNVRAASTVYVPTGEQSFCPYPKDDLVIEVALTGGCQVLVTGDRRHLLPLSPLRGMILEPPSAFLRRLEARPPR